VRKTFAAGQTVHLTEVEAAIRSTTGTLRINVQPANAQVSVVRAGGGPVQMPGGNTLDLDEGAYVVTARAQGFLERSEQVQVVSGQTAPVNLTLVREQRRPVLTVMGMEGWDSGAWVAEGQWFVRRGGGSVLYRATGRPGVYAFNIMVASGGSLLRGKAIEWVVDYADDRNHLLFRLDKNEFRRTQVVNGKRTELLKKPHGLSIGDYLMAVLQIEVAQGAITHRARNADQWMVLDVWSVPNRNFAQGRFGVVVSGRDEVRLSGFSFTPKE
jgi:hypothetical protein